MCLSYWTIAFEVYIYLTSALVTQFCFVSQVLHWHCRFQVPSLVHEQSHSYLAFDSVLTWL